MLSLSVYLVTEARQAIGRGYWDLVLLAVRAPFMRTFPTVWVPALCWVLLVVFGCWCLYAGTRGSRGPRDPMIALWAFNEMAIFGGLWWWGVHVPDDWEQARLINFALEGIYVSALVGGCLRFVLMMRGPGGGGAAHSGDQRMPSGGNTSVGRLRRF